MRSCAEMLMVIGRQIETRMAQTSVQVQKETSLSWLYFKYIEKGFDVICGRIHCGQWPAAWFSSYSRLPFFLPSQVTSVVQNRTFVHIWAWGFTYGDEWKKLVNYISSHYLQQMIILSNGFVSES